VFALFLNIHFQQMVSVLVLKFQALIELTENGIIFVFANLDSTETLFEFVKINPESAIIRVN
jgi:nucleoside permease NupC